ncbi:MAG TPA: exostosin family protein, partial [Chthoniobacterales bacterium]
MQLTAPATKVFLLPPKQVVTALPPLAETCYDQLRAGFALQTTHLLTDDPGSADLILAPIQNAGYGLRFEALRSSKIYQPYAGKLIVYSPDDNQFPSLRGLYPAAPLRWVRRGWALPAHYISSHIHRFSFSADEAAQKDLLFSFVGSSRTHPIREKILQWRHPRAVVLDSSSKSDRHYWWEKENKDDLLDSFREITRRSRFVVCPRGVSASSIRLFEAIEASSVPVIVADDLALPLGPNWEEFSIRVREREIDDVPRLIEHYADRAFEMGAAARRAWETYFSPEASIGSVVAWA